MRSLLRPTVVVVPLLLVLLGGGAVQAREGRLEKAETRGKAKIAKVWLDLARHLASKDLKTEATEALAKARALDPALKGLDDLASEVDALEGVGALDAGTERKVEKATRDAAKGYDRLAKAFAKEQDDPRYAAYLLKAIELDASKSRLEKLADVAKKKPLLMGSPTHDLVAWVSFPKSWEPGGSWPVLVSVEGAGCNFAGNAKQFRSSRGSRPFITVSPHALSCTNALKKEKFPAYDQALIDTWGAKRVDFDLPGLVALLDFLVERFGAQEKVAVTGFSGGGNLCYSLLLQHPDRVFCAAPACANFLPQLARGAPKVEDGGPPVHLLTGEKDPHRYLTHGKTPPGIEEQTDWAQKALAEQGFTNVTRTMLPGVGHSACPRQVWAFVDEVLEAD